MCGIFALLNSSFNNDNVNNEFMKGKSRGPEFSKLDYSYLKMTLGFHRLAINGLNNESNQPLVINDVVLICNGEIYNYKKLYETMNITPVTGSDCEVIIHLYIKYGIEQTLTMLDGVFSFILYDNRISEDLNNRLYVARDPYGVRPLYYLKNNKNKRNHTHKLNSTIYHNNNYSRLNSKLYGFASDLKCLEFFYNCSLSFNTTDFYYSIEQFKPGSYSIFNLSSKVSSEWKIVQENIAYFTPTFSHIHLTSTTELELYYKEIAYYLTSAVNKRCLATERPIACLLSGGLDSSLITGLVSQYYKKNNYGQQLETYSIGLSGSEDLKYASIVANYIKSKHTEILVTEQEMFEAIPEVILAIESYDTTTVRASIGNYLLGKYISTHSDAKVIFNGDGSDELFGGYLYMNKCPDDIEFDRETRRLLKDIHMFDVQRSDKSISSNGLEPRTPFLDKTFVNYVLSIPPNIRNHKNRGQCEKFLLRNAFTSENQILPDEILWRKKEAFSDGVSSHGRSLYQILQEQIAHKLNLEENTDTYMPSIETEKYYYKKLFDKYFPNCSHILPYFWMPKYTNATDPSARTLAFYENN
jgi:asparagine synthase (glutamine-hydrolysing)